MGPIFLSIEGLPDDLRGNLASLGAQPVSSRGLDGSIVNDGFVIATVTIPILKLLRDFVKTYFDHRTQTTKSLEFKYKGAAFKGYMAGEVLQFLKKIQRDQ